MICTMIFYSSMNLQHVSNCHICVYFQFSLGILGETSETKGTQTIADSIKTSELWKSNKTFLRARGLVQKVHIRKKNSHMHILWSFWLVLEV